MNDETTDDTEPKDANPSRFLVIDDEEVIHTSLRRMLGRRGHQVECVFRAEEGLQRLDDGSFDMIITDLMMPEVDGIELLDRLRDRDTSPPVLMITGYPTIKTALQALRKGAVDYVAKPFTRQELFGPINRALRPDAADDDPAPPSTEPPQAQEGLEVPDRDLVPGDLYYLRRHSWASFQQDGTMLVGIRASFLSACGPLVSAELPAESESVEQGVTGFHLRTNAGEHHGVLMPLSGQVVAVNEEAAAHAETIDAGTWLVRILPDRLESELAVLIKD